MSWNSISYGWPTPGCVTWFRTKSSGLGSCSWKVEDSYHRSIDSGTSYWHRSPSSTSLGVLLPYNAQTRGPSLSKGESSEHMYQVHDRLVLRLAAAGWFRRWLRPKAWSPCSSQCHARKLSTCQPLPQTALQTTTA